MSRDEARKILCKQLELLAEESKRAATAGDRAVLPEITGAMIKLAREVFPASPV